MFSIYLANGIDIFLGDPYWLPHPIRLIGLYIQYFEKLFYKKRRDKATIGLLGIILTWTTVFLSYGLTLLILKIVIHIDIKLYHIINIYILYTSIAGRCLHKEAFKIRDSLKMGQVDMARKQLSYIVGRDTDKMREEDIIKAVVETVSENTSDGIIAPLFYIFLGGAPLAMAYKAINKLDSMVGYKNERYIDYGRASAKLDDIANYIPSRLTAVFIILSAFFLGKNYKNAFKIMKRDRKKHLSPNSGYPESAAAGAIGISIGGASSYFGRIVVKPTIGDMLKEADIEDIKRVVMLMYGSWLLALTIFTLLFTCYG